MTKKSEVLVVKELPLKEERITIVDGQEFELVTQDEALTEILTTVREIKLAL